jgi:glycosyltransferase involved in cell wall biosynthesis
MSLVSVVIPAYNAERYLPEALASVFSQSHVPDEIIVVDDGSTDGAEELVRKHGNSIRFLKQPHRGAGATRNLGVESANGEYISFLDADDIWLPEKLSAQLDLLRTRPNVDMVFGRVRQFISPELDEAVKSSMDCPEEPMPGYHPGTMLMRKDIFLRVGGFETRLNVGEFIEWYLRAVEAGLQSIMLPDVVMCRRLHGKNLVIREKQSRSDYARILKASLDRRRAAQKGPQQNGVSLKG